MLTDQEIYNKVRTHLLTQMKKSTVQLHNPFRTPCTYDVCVYRGEDGRKCAIGVLIPDELYTKDIEGSDILAYRTLVLTEPLRKAGILPDNLDGKARCTRVSLLKELQVIHDNYEPYEWEAELTKLAKEFRLKVESC